MKKLCFVAALSVLSLSSWALTPEVISGSITPTYDLTAVIFSFDIALGPPYFAPGSFANNYYDLGPVSAGSTLNFTINNSISLDGINVLPASSYAIFSDYNNGGSTGVTLLFDNASAPSYIGSTWSFYVDEPLAYQSLQGSGGGAGINYDQLDRLWYQLRSITPAVGTDGTLVNFSTGTFGGTVTTRIGAVPEPWTGGLMAFGLIPLARKRKVRRD